MVISMPRTLFGCALWLVDERLGIQLTIQLPKIIVEQWSDHAAGHLVGSMRQGAFFSCMLTVPVVAGWPQTVGTVYVIWTVPARVFGSQL
jgi:hypothetical protein